MAFSIIKASSPELLIRFLNGLVISKRDLTLAGKDQRPNPAAAPNNLYKHPVEGLTLIFTTPAATVTFSADLDFKEILAEIEGTAGMEGKGHLLKTDPNGGMVLTFWDDTTPVVMSHTGTANAYFGFSTTAADPHLTQTATAVADVHNISTDPLSRQWIAFIAP